MAKRKPPTFTPPTPIIRGEELARAVKRQRAKRARATKSSRANLKKASARKSAIGGDAFQVTRDILQEQTLVDWDGDRGRAEKFWDESWEFTTEGETSYDELRDWRFELVQNKVIARYFDNKAVSVLLVVESHAGKRRGKMYLTGAASGDFATAMASLRKNLKDWSESYGRDAQDENFSRIREVTFLIRRGVVHKRWRSTVKGRAEERERSEDRTRAARRKRKK